MNWLGTQEAVSQLKSQYALSGLPLPGPFFSRYAQLLVGYVRQKGQARMDSLIKAYE
jgi:hypothetical protein